MKRVIGGVAYDTDAAESIATGSHSHETSDAWWRLYRTPSGVFFEVAADHRGIIERFEPLTDQQARRFLEVNSNSLVERYFGPAPDASRSLFSRRSVIAAIDVLEAKLTQAEISSLFTDFGPDVYEYLPNNGSAKSRMVDLKRYVDRNPLQHTDEGLLENVLVRRAITFLPPIEPEQEWSSQPAPNSIFDRLRRALSQDGFIVTDGELRSELPADVGLPQAESDLVRLLDKHGLATAKGHLDQALKNHAVGNWAAANSQIRAFIEGLFDELAVKLDPTAASAKSAQERRSRLANCTPPLLDRALNEWGDNGVGFVNGLMARLHPHGSHPGLSDEDDSTFRLHIVLLTARLFLSRYARANS